jgi:antitoxin PrlF
MSTATVTSKGQVTIPVAVRRELGLRPGSRLSFVPTDTGSYEIHVEAGSIRDLKGAVASPVLPVTLDEMESAIAEGASSAAL